jgi:hypothetical protein
MVLRGVVEKLVTPETLTLLNTTPKTPWPFPSVNWDVIRGSRSVAKPNVPNSEAQIVPRLVRSAQSASFIYLREKKVFEPTTIHWLRTAGQIAATNAEQAVMREITDLNMRFDNFAEFTLWQSLSGVLTVTYPDGAAIAVDYLFPATHKIAKPAVRWSTATPNQIVSDVQAWKRLIVRDARVAADTAYLTDVTAQYIFQSFANSGTNAPYLLSDRMKDQYYQTGTLPGFLGLNWTLIDSQYQDDNGNTQMFVPDGALYIGNYTSQRPMELFIGPSADDEAPDGFTGKFSKTWKEPDPSARQYLLEWSIMPVITRPEQMVVVTNVDAP